MFGKGFHRTTLGIAILLCVVIAIMRFAAAGRDDTFIILWAGKTFSFQQWFVNYNGAHEEIVSSTIAPWIAALGYAITPLTPLLFYKVVSLAVSAYYLYSVWQQRKIIFSPGLPEALVPLVIFSIGISPMFEYWTLGGLETPFQTLLFLMVPVSQVRYHLDRSRTNGIVFGFLLALLPLVRTEGFIYIFASLAFILIARRPPAISSVMRPILFSCISTVVLFSARFLFTGALWPNPTYAKIGGLLDQLPVGYSYVSGYYITGGAAAWLQGIGTICAISNLVFYTVSRKPRNALLPSQLLSIALSIYVVLHETFLVFCGGDWMEYYRFMVPTMPLKILLLVNSIAGLLTRLTIKNGTPTTAAALPVGVVLLCVGAAFQQTFVPASPGNCASPLSSGGLSALSLTAIENELIQHNCALGRDQEAVLPFIRNELPRYVQRVGQVRVASVQAGYFPYQIREEFSSDKVFFIDTLGLATREVALTAGTKARIGIADGRHLDKVLAGKAGRVSDVVLGMHPNMVYLIRATPDVCGSLAKLGYALVWNRPHALVFFKDPSTLGNTSEQLARQCRVDAPP